MTVAVISGIKRRLDSQPCHLTPGKRAWNTYWLQGWVSEPVWTTWRTEKLALDRNRSPDVQPVAFAIPIELSRLLDLLFYLKYLRILSGLESLEYGHRDQSR
jgi:hypothetical protein